ncbi:MAG TPA: glycosyltransferase, partial [Phycisphaerales bacterium]|nr:glycosyltransferase [Phycisphaerales bacterium]
PGVDSGGMVNTLWLAATNYTTQYDLINAFIVQVGLGAQSVGLPVNVSPGGGGGGGGQDFDDALRPAAIFFNYSPDFPAKAREAAQGKCAAPAVLQWLIDHPLTIGSEAWRAVEALQGYRLLNVSDDDAQLVALHFPGIRQARCWHGVDPSALCDAAALEPSHDGRGSRDIDVLVTGTVLSPEELAEKREQVPAPLRRVCEEMVALRLAHPWMAFTQAWDLCAPVGLHSATQWDLLRAAFLYTTAAVNTARRLALVRSLDGLRVTAIGRGPWQSAGVHGLTVVPEVRYADLPVWFARARVSLAVNPTQFVHGFSERLLLSLAGGAASVTDDRVWVRREFSACTRAFAPERPESCRQAVEALLNDRGACAVLGTAGRSVVAERHLWRHRVHTLAVVADHAGAELGWKQQPAPVAQGA